MDAALTAVPGNQFNDFLFASIGEDSNGMLVSVLSGLVRSNLDPWQEAANLARLPGEAATGQLAALIGALPDQASAFPDPRSIASRLVALLPRPAGFNAAPQLAAYGALSSMKSRPLWIYLILVCVALGLPLLIARHQTPVRSDDVGVKAASTQAAPSPPAISGQ
jgi:hypothetical protein